MHRGVLTLCTVAVLAAQEPPTFAVRTQLVQLTVRPGTAPKWVGRDWRAEDFSIVDNGYRREVAFFRSILIPLDLAVFTNLGGSFPEPDRSVFARESRLGFLQLSDEDRTASISAENCGGNGPGLLPRREASSKSGGGTQLNTNGPARPVPDPIKCAIDLLSRDEPLRAKALLILFDGRGPAISWEQHLRALLANHIAVYVQAVRTVGKSSGNTQNIGPFPPVKGLPPLPPGGRRPTPPTPVRDEVPLEGLDDLVRVSGGLRATMEPGKSEFAPLVKSMKDALLVGYYPPDEPGWHEVRIDLNVSASGGTSPVLQHQQRYYQ